MYDTANIIDFNPPATTDTITTTTTVQNYCSSCNTWYYGWPHAHTCWHIHTDDRDEARELQAWLDGFTQGRALSAKNLAVIRKKLREFCGE